MNVESDRICLAALSDIHTNIANYRYYIDLFDKISKDHDAILVTGDLTDSGNLMQASLVASVFLSSQVPVYAVLGNHDLFHHDHQTISRVIETHSKARILQGNATLITKGDRTVQVVGVTGHSGGFTGFSSPPPTQEDRAELSRQTTQLDQVLANSLRTETIVLMHYSPIVDTIVGEPSSIYHLLGSSRFESVLDRYSDRILRILHGHAHHGSFSGSTKKGIMVNNVALSVLQKEFEGHRLFTTIEI